MPISYESAAPVGAMGAVGRLQGRQLAAAANYGGGGGGGGGGHGYQYGVPYDPGTQDAIQFRDQLQFQEQRHADDVTSRYGLQQMQGDQAMAQDRQRFELQAQLHDVELSQQERMRLQRLKNSIGEVTSDPSLTDEEKKDYISQIKYNVDPLQRRLAQEKLAQEKIVKDSLVEQHQAKSALNKQTLDIMAKSVPDRTPFVPDPSALSNIAADFKKNIGPTLELQFGPQMAQEMIGKMAQEEALKQGLGTHAYLQPDGKLVPFDRHGAPVGSEGSASPGGTTKKVDHPTGVTAEQYDKIHAEVIDSVDKKIAMREKDAGSGGTKPVYPQDPDWRAKSIESEFQARLARLKDYNDQASAGASKGYKSPFAKPGAAPGAAAAATPGADRTPKEFVISNLDDKAAEFQTMEGVSDDEKAAASQMLARTKAIVTAHPDPHNRPDDIKAELRRLADSYDKLRAKAKPPMKYNVSPPGGLTPPADVPWWQKAGELLQSGAGGGGGAGGGYGGKR